MRQLVRKAMHDPAQLNEDLNAPIFSEESTESKPTPAHRSTGPRTPAGKSRSSKNSVKHGCRSNIVILPDEKQEDFDALYDRWKEAYQPDTDAALELLEQFVLEKWYLLRNERRYSEVEHQLSFHPFTKWNDAQHKIFQLAGRYKTAAQRSASKAQRDLEDYLKNRRAEDKHRQHLIKDTLASHRQMEKDIERGEQASEKQLRHAEALGLDISKEKTEFAEIKERNRATLTRIRDNAAALDVSQTRVQLLFDGQHSPKRLRETNSLEQSVEVTTKNGVTITDLTPSNQQLIERAQTMDPPPEIVYRRLNFPHGVLGEYAWVTDDPLTRKYGGFGVQRIPLLTWLDLVDAETLRADGHVGPCNDGHIGPFGDPLRLATQTSPANHSSSDCPACNLNRERLQARNAVLQPQP